MGVSRRLLVVLLLASAFIVGCGRREEFHDPKVFNATDQTIEVFVVAGGVEVSIGPIKAHTTGNIPWADGQCVVDTLIARDGSGKEIARRSEPLCADESWNVGQ